jgi:DNA-binding GntR family transcriptional regulator
MHINKYIENIDIKLPTASESVLNLLRKAIVEGALPDGSTLRQEEIAKKFGVSRVPIRDALQKLESEGFVQSSSRRGLMVTTLTTDDFEEILEMRLSLESLAIDLAIKNFNTDNLAAALKIVTEAEDILKHSSGNDFLEEFETRWGGLNWAFHHCIYAPSNRPRLIATIKNLQELFARHVRMKLLKSNENFDQKKLTKAQIEKNVGEWNLVLKEHRLIALACSRHDALDAKKILREHIRNHGMDLVEKLKNISMSSVSDPKV